MNPSEKNNKKAFSIAEMVMSLLILSLVALMTAPMLSRKISTSIAKIPNVQSGTVIMYSGKKIPKGWKLCDGTNDTPDLRDRFIAGAGGGYAVRASGGASTVTLTQAELPDHMHYFSTNYSGIRSAKLSKYWGAPGGCSGYEGAFRIVFGSTGGNRPHENLPPYYKLVFIMKE